VQQAPSWTPVVLAVAVSFALGACGDRSLPSAKAQERSAPALPRAVRPGIKAAMSRHAEQASSLAVSVALGSYEQTMEHVDALLAEPRPAPPLADDLSTLNQLLPARLLELDDAFRSALVKLRGAAEARDDDMSITRLGAVVRACRNCHRRLREEPPASRHE
jgi:hypothetical protein